MKTRPLSKVVSCLLVLLMIVGLLPAAALAADYDVSVSGSYYNVLSKNTWNLAPGATETELILNNAEGSRRQIAHIFEVDTKNENIQVLPGYYGIDKLDPDNLEDNTHWTDKKLTETVKYYEEVLGYNVIGAMNTALAYDSNAPYGYMVYNGVVLGTPAVHPGASTYLAIDKEGNCELRSMSTPLDGSEWTAIPANFGWLVKDGKMMNTSTNHTAAGASRSMVGVKADGTLVFCQVDGRVAPTSVGLNDYEMAEMMMSLGCVNAFNCDGGGSSTFISKREGETDPTMRSIPSDGSERPTINSVIIVSTAKATGEFDHAVLNSDYDYYAPLTSAAMNVIGVDAAGSPAEVPAEGITWALADDSFGTVANGVFTSNGKLGDVTIQMLYQGEKVGERTIHVVTPDVFKFSLQDTVLPYGKSMTLEFASTYGADSWAVCVDGAYTLALSDPNAAALQGTLLTAPSDESIKGVVVTATYTPNPTVTAAINVQFGKGSEVIYDFEDGSLAGFMGFSDAKQWSIDNGVNNTLVGTDPLAGQFNPYVDSKTFLSTTEKGTPVKSGSNALAWRLDNTDGHFGDWTYNVLFNVGESIVLRDVANGKNATSLGMWLYIPEGAAGLAFQSQFYTKDANGNLTHKQDHFTFITVSGVRKNLNSCTEEDIPESRWVYASIDISKYDFLCTPVASNENVTTTRSPSFIRTYVKPTTPAELTFYIDDITLDYSAAVPDRVLPTISDVSYATQDTAIELTDGAVINGNSMAFSANVADNVALDNASARIYVDGIALSGVSVSGKVMSSKNVTLTSGVHTITFEIKDSEGNLAAASKTVVVAGDKLIDLSGHNDSGLAPEYDSIYYVDINTTDASAVDGLVATLKLQTANKWELEGAVAAEGFEAAYAYDEATQLLTVTLKRVTGIPVPASGETTLVSIPVRIWSWDGINVITGQPYDASTGGKAKVSVECEVVYGSVTFADNAFAGYESAFGGSISVQTNVQDTNTHPWHVHDEELTVLHADPSCLTDGYTGRTYCEGCKSVIDWGTVIPATGHTFEIVDNHLVCDCGAAITGSGLVEANGKLYCLIADKVVTGWQMVGTDWCYADPITKTVHTGEFSVSGLTYTANESGVVVKGAWAQDANGLKYSYGPAFYTRVWKEIDGATYYFGTNSYVYTGIRSIPVNRNNLAAGVEWYEFAEDGKLVKKMTDYTGFLTENGIKYYVKDGMNYYGGLMLIDGDYYYARSSGEIVCGRSYYISKNNDLLPVASYTFDADGKMVNAPVTEPDPEPPVVEPDPEPPVVDPTLKNGIVEENGKLYWYVDDVKTYGGLMLIDGNYYYARSSGEIVCGRSYYISKNNGLLPVASYTFDADGKMVNPPEAN